MFGVKAINLFAQRGILYFIHQAPPVRQPGYSAARRRRNLQNIHIYRCHVLVRKWETNRK
jgi:hypothetical protein